MLRHRPGSRLIGAALAIAIIGAVCAITSAAHANLPPRENIKAFAPGSYLSSREFVTSITVLVFGTIMVVVASLLLTIGRQAIEPIIRLFALIIIVSGTLFLVAAGYNASEIAPSLGLLGSIAGYLLGRGAHNATSKPSRTDVSQSGPEDD